MKHEVYITPLNCSFDKGINAFTTFDEEVFNNSTKRSLLFKDPYVSWFKFKDIDGGPYLEPALFGINVGDIITIDFDMVSCVGEASTFGLGFFCLKDGLITTPSMLEQHYIPRDTLGTILTHFTLSIIASPSLAGGDGVLLNLRSINPTNGTEYIVKNLKLTVETDNPNFALSNNVVDYETKRDFIKMINHVSGTTLCSSTFKNNQTLYDNGSIYYQDGALHYDVVPGGKWAGIVSVLSQNSYGSPIVVYLEYKYTKGSNRIYSQAWSSSDARVGAEQFIEFPSNTTDKYVKHIMYFKGVPGEDIKYNIVNMGSASYPQSFSIKRMIVSIPRFDDENKKDFNAIEELYPNKRFNE